MFGNKLTLSHCEEVAAVMNTFKVVEGSMCEGLHGGIGSCLYQPCCFCSQEQLDLGGTDRV